MPQPSGTIRSRLFRALGHLRIRARTGRPPRRALRVGLVTAVLATVMVGLAPAGTAAGSTAGNITAFRQSGTTSTVSTSSGTAVRVVFVRADIFRIQLAPDGRFTDPAGSDLTVNTAFGTPTVTATDRGSYYEIATTAVTLRAYKRPLTFAAYRPDGTLLWQESKPTAWTASRTTQYLGRGPAEQYYGTGLRLGPWALRDQTVPIAVDNTWKPNSNASPAPFYMSSNGYGVLRNTWAPGSYAFTDPVATTENEKRFDAYYFVADSLKGVLGAYTDVTGKPFLAPIWGLELGNADCFNASNPDYTGDHTRARHQTTPDVVGYAQDARKADMPSGWILPNDGYGCGYTDLRQTVSDLAGLGFHTGLWTSTGLSDIKTEVGTDGSRGVKTDVAWIGGGYKGAFDGVNQAVAGIEDNSDARRFVWTVDGWAGTQRNAVVWTGDTRGDWPTMGWTVPAVVGAGLSGLNYASGDVDGIFGGSPETYTRDLQWKAFTPAFMTMSGWGATNPAAGYTDKQPWRFAEPYLSANRKALQTKMRLMPYLYTMSQAASTTGVPSTRALVLEYPDDPVAQGNATAQEFMAGDSFLVAPVTTGGTTRDGIYLPAGTWTDYWTGRVYQGPTTLNGYAAPLDSTPVFVKGGGIVPMWPQMNHTGEKPVSTLTYDLYPSGRSAFSLYEDDGLTRAYRAGASARQQVTVDAPAAGTGTVTVQVGASTGSYAGKPAERGYELTVHLAGAPTAVNLGPARLARQATMADYDAAATGWFFDPADRGGVLRVKAGSQSGAFTVTLPGATLPTPTTGAGGSPALDKSAWKLVSADSQETAAENGAAANAFDGSSGSLWHTAYSGGTPAELPHEIRIDLGARNAVDGLRYLPRQDGGVNGRIGRYEVYVSDSATSWGSPVATGTWADTGTEKTVSFPAAAGRYLRLRALSEAGDRGPWTSAAEITATGAPAAKTPAAGAAAAGAAVAGVPAAGGTGRAGSG
ncbi:glycoside hydrolase family 31 protein [Kitasatospora sp. CM 4170]|uniref:TIM-barrel domain-containing protein n=1 Tax=Kitasatospora aburaviensis TaxID=67265 RepID=A0ABW1F4G9_9ACTN|nr:TIM-barrel domain-containing protein [Kitasatospora sp. CM 4170]WNM49816.1 glycoside hydrolase family 31 protein [Kitasatospora sp. CM 4170]